MDQIDQTISGYVKNNEISGGALLVRKAGEVVYQNKWGYADVAAGAPVEYDSIYRMMSMTKPVTAVTRCPNSFRNSKICRFAPISDMSSSRE